MGDLKTDSPRKRHLNWFLNQEEKMSGDLSGGPEAKMPSSKAGSLSSIPRLRTRSHMP